MENFNKQVLFKLSDMNSYGNFSKVLKIQPNRWKKIRLAFIHSRKPSFRNEKSHS